MPGISLRQIGFLVALSDELNFSRAAEACNVTQPTLSAGLRELEGTLGVQLAERTRRSVIMTPVGREIAERGRRLLIGAQDIETLAAEQSKPHAGDLTLGAIPTIGPFLLPRALPRIRDAFPNLRLFLREEMTESLLDGLHGGRLDAVVIAQPFEIGNLETAFMFDDGYHLAAPPSQAEVPDGAVTGEVLTGKRLMLLEKGHCLQRHALSAYPGADIRPDESFSATSLSTLIAMVSEGLGITLLPDLSIDAGAARGSQLRLAPLADACPRHVVMAWRKTSARAGLFRDLAALLTQSRDAMRTA
ncbi:hydrogen peroxide-inducible genes activator [Roseovarius salinarum]|uniref:hydrogen peroxide-inducible genes activator n=1 Tax=Roseovarius salinarum TaxID=1981892 RepID=UPI000C31DAF4|nr:hydrogen peroxide-inducible genes activator [Roseovarius salinarum]